MVSSSEYIEITGHELATKLDIDVSKYPFIPRNGHGLYQPSELLGETKFTIPEEVLQKIQKSKSIFDKFKTGQIWYDNTYEIYYLILGKIDKKHVVLVLGGDTLSQGAIETGYINGNDDLGVFCDIRIF